ncbi:AMP-binding protein [Mesorhizobium sp.]|uniref:AMP-binding protein n=1 Tax=Mesorhizobium sp. TaxID=1871066 RepID=UPI000FE7D583|nr:AMP-binding protein [Mesorhizobium sp.]RWP61124.1 MAG: hypothetical protein EOR08_18640 [Mesorhizobium sp.]
MYEFTSHRDASQTIVDSVGRTAAHLEAMFERLQAQPSHYQRIIQSIDGASREPLSVLGALPRTDRLAYRTVLGREALENVGGESFVTDFSSGSCSRPVLRFCRAADDLCEQEATERALRRAGVGPHDRLAFVDVGAAQIYDFYARAARGLGVADIVFLPLTSRFEPAVKSLAALRPSIVFTIPSLIARIWRRLEATELSEYPPRLVISVGEPISAALRATVKDAWHCRVMSFFGTTETGGFAGECQCEDGHHFDPCENVVTIGSARRLDDFTIEGELLLTTPHLRTHRVIKYAVGDIVRVSLKPCACGEPTPRLWHVRRTQDAFTFAGESFTYDMICETLRKVAPLLHSVTLEIEEPCDSGEQVLLRAVIPDEFRSLRAPLARVLCEDIFELDCLVRYGLVRIEVVCMAQVAPRRAAGRKRRRLVDLRV